MLSPHKAIVQDFTELRWPLLDYSFFTNCHGVTGQGVVRCMLHALPRAKRQDAQLHSDTHQFSFYHNLIRGSDNMAFEILFFDWVSGFKAPCSSVLTCDNICMRQESRPELSQNGQR